MKAEEKAEVKAEDKTELKGELKGEADQTRVSDGSAMAQSRLSSTISQ